MGQYYIVVNLDKRQFIHPHKFGDGLKLREFGFSSMGTMSSLAVLLADGNGRGGGDLLSDNPVIGSWAGDRIVIAGDYADKGKFIEGAAINLYEYARNSFEDISAKVLASLLDDGYFRENTEKSEALQWSSPFKETFAQAKTIREATEVKIRSEKRCCMISKE